MRPDLPPYVLITPARNEEAFLERTIDTMVRQTARPVRWVIVNDGSTDGTPRVARAHAARHDWITVVDMPLRRDRSFAAKVRCFDAGYAAVRDLAHDVVGNLDADISFDADYVEFLLERFAEDPALGVAGTVFEEPDGYRSDVDSFEGEQHVAGGCQLFRRRCFEEIGGYVPNRAGGVDWIAVTTARMRGWRTRAFREKAFFHHRSLGTAERNTVASAFSYGEKDYYLGGHPLWELCRVAYRLRKRPYVVGGVAVGLGYLAAALRRVERPVSAELMRFHRREQLRKLAAIARSLARLEPVDSFQVASPGPGPAGRRRPVS
jgi:glycosyltransferase involved in cell wall biosynthesis